LYRINRRREYGGNQKDIPPGSKCERRNLQMPPRGAERLRNTPSPHRSDADIGYLVQARAAEVEPAKAA
jgi:hypothetical protein